MEQARPAAVRAQDEAWEADKEEGAWAEIVQAQGPAVSACVRSAERRPRISLECPAIRSPARSAGRKWYAVKRHCSMQPVCCTCKKAQQRAAGAAVLQVFSCRNVGKWIGLLQQSGLHGNSLIDAAVGNRAGS